MKPCPPHSHGRPSTPMRHVRSSRVYRRLLILATLFGILLPQAVGVPQLAVADEADAIRQLIYDTVLTNWTVGGPRFVWYAYPDCQAGKPYAPVRLLRIKSSGSPARVIFERSDPSRPNVCIPYAFGSNVVADDQFVYWVEGGTMQLVRLSVDANPSDVPQPFGPAFLTGTTNQVELSIGRGKITAVQVQDCTGCLIGTRVELVSTTDGSSIGSLVPGDRGRSPSFDGNYIYYKFQDNQLRRIVPGNNPQPFTIGTTDIDEYLAEGESRFCSGILCPATNYVYYIRNDFIVRFNNINNEYITIYKAPSSTQYIALLNGLTEGVRSGGNPPRNLFFFEKRIDRCILLGCNPAPAIDLLRTIRRNGGDAVDLYARSTDNNHHSQDLFSDGTALYWKEQAVDSLSTPAAIFRLPTNAPALARINLRATGLQITQGIQRNDNSVPLIRDRRTFVRFFVRSDGADVPGVTARLRLSATGLPLTYIEPINPIVGKVITVVGAPDQDNINQSFLFELPWNFTRATDLRILAELNPYGIPLEPTSGDNQLGSTAFAFKASPTLTANLVSMSYTFNGTVYDVDQMLETADVSSLVRGMFPVASTPGFVRFRTDGFNGFRPLLKRIVDNEIANRINFGVPVANTPAACMYLVTFEADGTTVKTDDRNRCASEYVIGQLQALRTAKKLRDYSTYAFIPAPAGLAPRGWASGGIAAGPTGDPLTVAHELGHNLGRKHPFKGSALEPVMANRVCGNTLADGAIDNTYPYEGSLIGPGDGTVTGLNASGATPTIIPDDSGHDFMGYCTPNRWVSDYTYRCILKYLEDATISKECDGSALAGTLGGSTALQAGGVGDWLNIVGVIGRGGAAQIFHLRRIGNVADTPARVPGPYSIHLVNGAGKLLADYPFTPVSGHHSGSPSFALAVPFVVGTREVRLVTTAPSAGNSAFICDVTTAGAAPGATMSILARRSVSAFPPTVSGVALLNPPNPVAGTVTLRWNASDTDGDSLRFDVLSSRDGGLTFLPIQLNLTGNTLAINTAALGGGPTIFQVVASDGAQSATANSQSYALAAAPPQPQIASPRNGAHYEWGQVINFSGAASDPQDGAVDDTNLVWSDQRGQLGTGPLLSTTDLPIGRNTITLTATNSAGRSASVSITVVVGDAMLDPGPTLAVAPTAINFSVAPGTMQIQTAEMQIGNAGGGTLSWTASSDVSWLTLSAGSGDAPAQLTIAANPRRFAEGQVARATIRLTSATAGVQTVLVPVTLTIGNTFTPPLPSGEKLRWFMSLPVVRR